MDYTEFLEITSIKSVNSTENYYLGVENDSSAADAPIVLRTGTLTNGMKWRIGVAASGALKISSESGEQYNRALAVGSYILNINGIDIEQRNYNADTDYIDEWVLTQIKYTASVYNYYDNGYPIRYGETETASIGKINSYIDAVSMQYLKIFGLDINTSSAAYYSSAIDGCKGTVTSGNIDTLCTHTNPHTILFDGVNSISNHLNNTILPSGSDLITNAYWSGHSIQTNPTIPEYNRCYSNGHSIYMIELSPSSDRDTNSKGVLMHELNHQYGAPDHYHEILTDGTCRGGDICSECGISGLRRPSSCIMNHSRIDITASTVICDGCRGEMIDHLEDHHRIS